MLKQKLQKSNFINDISRLRDTLSQTWLNIQSSLFPWLSEELGPLTEKQQELVSTLEVVRIEEFIYSSRGFPGRPPQDRTAIARAFVAKTIYNLPTTRALLDRLETDSALRRICGWERKNAVPDEWTFSRAPPGSRNPVYPSGSMKRLLKKAMQAKSWGITPAIQPR